MPRYRHREAADKLLSALPAGQHLSSFDLAWKLGTRVSLINQMINECPELFEHAKLGRISLPPSAYKRPLWYHRLTNKQVVPIISRDAQQPSTDLSTELDPIQARGRQVNQTINYVARAAVMSGKSAKHIVASVTEATEHTAVLVEGAVTSEQRLAKIDKLMTTLERIKAQNKALQGQNGALQAQVNLLHATAEEALDVALESALAADSAAPSTPAAH